MRFRVEASHMSHEPILVKAFFAHRPEYGIGNLCKKFLLPYEASQVGKCEM